MKTKITVICENTVSVPKLTGEFGLSFLIERDKNTLFDTGQGIGIIQNLKMLGKDINKIERIILSHGHFDHTGGLAAVLKEKGGKTPVFVNPDIFTEKVTQFETSQGNVTIPIGLLLKEEGYESAGAEFMPVEGIAKIDDGIFACSNIKRAPGWKTWDVRLKQRKNDAVIDDPFNDDLSLLLETESGPVVILGCAHAGIVEILDNIAGEKGYKEFHAVIGGTHLGTAPLDYVNRAIDALKKYKVKVIGTSHCTGFRAAATIFSNFQNEFRESTAGAVFEF